jgi:hypothetical protein
MELLANYKLRMYHEKEERIFNAHAVINGDTVRISYGYKMEGGLIKTKYIVLPTLLDCAKFFKRHELIDYYTISGEVVRMYRFAKIRTWSRRGEVEERRPYEVKLEDIDLNPSICLTICAVEELPIKDRVDSIMRYFISGARYIAMFI